MIISYVMQVYLGDYNTDVGGRCKSAKAKFIRALNSLLNQEYDNIEIIIVADGCELTKSIYYSINEWRDNPKIKFIFLGKQEDETYKLTANRSRGIPRQVGRALATGHVTTYLDADDVALPNHSKTLALYWASALKNNPEKLMCLNNAWYDHETVFQFDEFKDLEAKAEEAVEIEGLESKWLSVGAKPGKISINTGLISHRSHLDITWKDNDIKGLSEDTMFGNDCIKKHGANSLFQIQTPIHVRCHNWKCWDY